MPSSALAGSAGQGERPADERSARWVPMLPSAQKVPPTAMELPDPDDPHQAGFIVPCVLCRHLILMLLSKNRGGSFWIAVSCQSHDVAVMFLCAMARLGQSPGGEAAARDSQMGCGHASAAAACNGGACPVHGARIQPAAAGHAARPVRHCREMGPQLQARKPARCDCRTPPTGEPLPASFALREMISLSHKCQACQPLPAAASFIENGAAVFR